MGGLPDPSATQASLSRNGGYRSQRPILMLEHRTLFQMHFEIADQPFQRKSGTMQVGWFRHAIREQGAKRNSISIDRFQIVAAEQATKGATPQEASFEPHSFFIAETHYG